MSLRDEITPEIIANTISQDNFDGYYILVEGETDELFYSKFLNSDSTQIEICHGKENVLDAIEILNKRKSKRNKKPIAIVDKDYDFIEQKKHPQNVIETDLHDVEMMCLKSNSFENVAREYFSNQKVERLKQNDISCLRTYFLDIILPISKLRIINKTESLNLAFKSTVNKPKELKYEKFICKDSLSFKGYDSLIDAVKSYYNQAVELDNSSLITKIKTLDLNKYDAYDICHGHDLTKAIQIGLKKKIGKSKLSGVKAEEIERALRLAFSMEDFTKTDLIVKLKAIDENIVRNNVA